MDSVCCNRGICIHVLQSIAVLFTYKPDFGQILFDRKLENLCASFHCFIRVIFISVVAAPNVIQLCHAFSIAVHSNVHRMHADQKNPFGRIVQSFPSCPNIFRIIARVVDNFKVESSSSSVYITFWNLGFILVEFTVRPPGVTLDIRGVIRRKRFD